MPAALPAIFDVYANLLDHALISLRMRIRCGEFLSSEESQDFADALHNVPEMLRNYGNWYVEANIDAELARYDALWMGKPGSEWRRSLIALLQEAKNASSPSSEEGE